jgi:hypothetical protein
MYRRIVFITLATVVGAALFLNFSHWRASAAETATPAQAPARIRIGQRPAEERPPGPAIEPYVRPEFARQMRSLRPAILEAARRHNRPELSHMTDREFAVVIALVLYNENFGSLEDRLPPLRPLTPFYQEAQFGLNTLGGGDLSVWPANLRPSVALEILRHELPVPDPKRVITEPIDVAGSLVNPDAYQSRQALYAALTEEIADPTMAVEYLAANLERGLYRARFEGVPVTWRTLAAWHNQGIVSPRDIRDNPTARDYVRRTSAYVAAAYALIDTPDCHDGRCKVAHARGPT